MLESIYIGSHAIDKLLEYCKTQQYSCFALVADTNTYSALGKKVEAALRAHGYTVTTVTLSGNEVIADERNLVQTLLQAPVEPRCVFLAVGSGTLTDITRFVSHRSGRAFISIPTAPSVDGFTSIGAPLILDGVKQTINCQAPIALFADLETLCNAPKALIAAGYGDMLGKITSLADWQLGSLLWDEPFDNAVCQRVRAAVETCLSLTDQIAQCLPEAVEQLMAALIESGLCMLAVGNSRPASGAEHHASHYWEMKLLKERRPPALHGLKVGFALTLIAEEYARLCSLSREEMLKRLDAAALPDRESELSNLQLGYGELAESLIDGHRAFLEMSPERFSVVKQRIADHWEEIQAIAATVLPTDQLRSCLQTVGAPTTPAALGLQEEEIQPGLQYGHYLRDRFTVLKLNRILGL